MIRNQRKKTKNSSKKSNINEKIRVTNKNALKSKLLNIL